MYIAALGVNFSHNGRVEHVENNTRRMKMRRRYQYTTNEDDLKTDLNQDDSQNKSTKPTEKIGKSHLTRTRYTFHQPSKSALLALILARLISGRLNVISDCDEVYNYWEPLHFALYGTGMQTWEYSSQYALRPWLYILLHAIPAWPLAILSSISTPPLPPTVLLPPPKVLIFYTIKTLLGLLSALSEYWLYTGVKKRFQSSVANIFLLMLIFSSGMFAASTALLPSSFSMYALTTAAAAVLHNKPRIVIIAAFVGVIWGWSVAAIAFLPYAPYILFLPMLPGNKYGGNRSRRSTESSNTKSSLSLLNSLLTALVSTVVTLAPLTLIDRWYYGKWTSSLINFIKYNVVGGGDSALYGVESWSYYLRNGFNNLQLVLPLALCITPWLALLGSLFTRNSLSNTHSTTRGREEGSDTTATTMPRKERKWYDGLMMMWWLSPAYIWLLAISLLPHKEERFLYVVYPILCLSGAIGLSTIFELISHIMDNIMPRGIKKKKKNPRTVEMIMFTDSIRRVVLLVIILMGVSRSMAMKMYYGAPMELYAHLPPLSIPSLGVEAVEAVVCVGSEWHRYPSSFFLPAHGYAPLQFVKSGFGGLLPRPFDTKVGGAAASPDQLNDRNKEEPGNYWTLLDNCDYFITTLKNEGTEGVVAGDPLVLEENEIETNEEQDASSNGGGTPTRWIDNVVAEYSFVENQHSPAWARAFYIPWLTWEKCSKVRYVLLQNPKKNH